MALVLAATVAVVWVLVLNGRALFYFDTIEYIKVGTRILNFFLPEPVTAAGGAGAAPLTLDGDGVNLARSPVYALIVAAAARFASFNLLIVAQAGLVLALAWVTARTLRRDEMRASIPWLSFAPLILCGITSLPFYVAYLMPDLLAPLGIIAAALIAVAARRMPWVDLFLCWAVVAVAVQVHLSHLPILAALVPVAALVALLQGRHHWIRPPLWLGTAVLAGTLPIFAVIAFTTLETAPAPKVDMGVKDESPTVRFTPFITARLIVDGPGMAYLNDHCPNPDIATCRLHEALGWSDDPWRLTASHIIFETDPGLGSLRLLSIEDQRAIATEQGQFLLMVLKERPFGVLRALLENTLQQLPTDSIEMTLPTTPMVQNAAEQFAAGGPSLGHGRITRSRGWIDVYDAASDVLYGVSAVVVLGLLLTPWGGPDRTTRLLALVVLTGIFTNALVCGGISQPAARYGARVIWLLPWLAMLLALASRRHPGLETQR